MKIRYVLLIACMVYSTNVFGQLLSDDFDYTTGQNLTANGWTAHSSAGSQPITVSAGGLSYTGHSGTGIGNAAQLDNTGEDINRTFTAQTSGTVYYSFLLQVSSLPGSAGYFAHLINSGTNFAARVFIQTSGSNFVLGVANGTTATYGTTLFSTGNVYLVIVKYDFAACSLWVKSSGIPTTEAAAGTPEAVSSGSAQASVSAIALRQYVSTQNMLIDGIRVATAWNSSFLPVELTSFYSNTNNGKVKLNWSTATEVNNNGFDVQRSTDQNSWKSIAFIAGAGNSNSTRNYTYTDNSVQVGTYYYRLKQVDNDGTFSYNNAIEVKIGTPDNFSLEQNYPNPFNPGTVISYSVPQAAKVELQVYSLTGQLVTTLVNETKEAGYYTASFNGAGLSSGLYIYQLKAGNVVQTRKMTLLK